MSLLYIRLCILRTIIMIIFIRQKQHWEKNTNIKNY